MNSDNLPPITAILIVEVLGKPPEHLTEALKEIVEKMGTGDGIEVTDSTINIPHPVEKQPGLYTAFVEIEVALESINHLVSLMFNFMPAHVEILTPENITVTNNDWNYTLNELGRKLHQYDGLAKMIQMEKKVLEDKVRSLSAELEERGGSGESKNTKVQEGV